MATALSAWREARARKRATVEGKQMVAEARRILRKRSYRIPDSVSAEIEHANGALEAAMAGSDGEQIRAAMGALEEKMDQHLAFARKSSVREYSESIGVAVAIALFLRAFVVEAFQIPSGSMIPTLEIGDHIFVSKFSYGLVVPFTNKKIFQYASPRRGDVIVFKFPHQTEIDYIKRVIGLPGDKVEIRRNEIFINGRPMERTHDEEKCRYAEGPQIDGFVPERDCERWIETLDGRKHVAIHEPNRETNYGPLTIPNGHVFVMGDNRDNSNDSRAWGTVPEELIKGRALIVWWSRGPTDADLSGNGVKQWFDSIRWRRFFKLVE
jgi:signal peptidase I